MAAALRRGRAALGVVSWALLATSGCTPSPSAPSTPTAASCPTVEALVAPGKWTFTRHDFDLVDDSRTTPKNGSFSGASARTLRTRVWLPDGEGPFPLILHSHGLSDSRLGEVWLTEHLASWGYAVAAPDFPLSGAASPGGPTPFDVQQQPADVRFVRDRLLASDLGPLLDPERVALSGLSLGGMTALLATYHRDLRIPDVRATFAMAPLACVFSEQFFTTTRVPLAIVHGDDDILLPYPEHALRTFERATQPGFLATLAHGTHVGFTSFGTALSSTTHYDRIGCSFIPAGAPQFPALGGADVGVTTGECPISCGSDGTDPPLDAKLQQEITNGLAVAFFARYLRNPSSETCDDLSRLDATYVELTIRSNP